MRTEVDGLVYVVVLVSLDDLIQQWDRQPFWNATGDESYAYPYREIVNNLWINNYNPQEATDNDDGSAFCEEAGWLPRLLTATV